MVRSRAIWMRFAVMLAALLAAGCSAYCQPEAVDPAAVQALATTLEETGQKWFEVVSDQPDNPDLNGFAGWLRARPDIVDATVGSRLVEATSADGIAIRFTDYEPGVAGTRSSPRRLRAREAVAGRYASLPSALPLWAVPREMRCYGDLVPQGKALIIDVLGDIVLDVDAEMRKILEYAGFEVVEKAGEVRDFLEMATASIVVVHSHGGTTADKKHYVVVAKYFESTDVSNLTEYYTWLKGGELAVERSVKRHKVTKQPLKVVTGIDIYDTWFEKNLPSMVNNAALFFITCHSADLDTPWCIFKAKGASFFFGFDGVIGAPWDCEWATRLLDRVMGANIHDPWDKNPYRRPQSFEDAYSYILTRPQYQKHPVWGGVPIYHVHQWDDACFSAYPHIDLAQIEPVPDAAPDYLVSIQGAFGCEDEYSVYCGGERVPIARTGYRGGTFIDVLVPLDTTGPLVVHDKWGRHSNVIMISRFTANVEFDYDDMECAGKVKLKYDSLVTGTRLYRRFDPEMIYAGMPEKIKHVQYVMVPVGADWKVEWDFHSTKRIGAATIRARGNGVANGRGEARDDESPDGSVSVSLLPSYGSIEEPICKANVLAGARVGPIEVTYDTPAGAEAKEIMVTCVSGLPVTCDYDQMNGILPAVSGGMWGISWKMDEVKITPNPYDLDYPAWLPEQCHPARRLAGRLR